jgi:NADPH-dependent 2,4-dienoyl-CoA reductase/sulfur reductase-like enzyme
LNKPDQRKDISVETNKTIDVLIVGAGPTGLALAYQLRRLGVSFHIQGDRPAIPRVGAADMDGPI